MKFEGVDIGPITATSLTVVGPNGTITIEDDATFGSVIRLTDSTGAQWIITGDNTDDTHFLQIRSPDADGGEADITLSTDPVLGPAINMFAAAVRIFGALSVTGAVSGSSVSASGTVSGSSVSASGTVSGSSVSASGTVSGSNVQATGEMESFGAGQGVLVHSVNGSRWRLGVTNSGALFIGSA